MSACSALVRMGTYKTVRKNGRTSIVQSYNSLRSVKNLVRGTLLAKPLPDPVCGWIINLKNDSRGSNSEEPVSMRAGTAGLSMILPVTWHGVNVSNWHFVRTHGINGYDWFTAQTRRRLQLVKNSSLGHGTCRLA